MYTKVLKSYPQRTQEDRNRAMASAVEVLKTIHGLSPQVAGANLRLVLAELDRQRSYDLRSLAVQYEMSGDWEQALQHYEQAASLRVERDDRDYQFLMKCIQRVRDKQARSART